MIKKKLIKRVESKRVADQNKTLKVIFAIVGVIALLFLTFLLISRMGDRFTHRGVDWEVVKFCDSGPPCLVTYKTTLPVKVTDNRTYLSIINKTHEFNFYLRNDPRKLEVPFDGEIRFKPLMALHPTDDFICEGKGAIAGANLVQLYKILGTEVITDRNATCDPQQRYIYLDIKSGNETRINEFYPSCYQLTIKDCEVLEGTEKLMIEAFVSTNKILKEQGYEK